MCFIVLVECPTKCLYHHDQGTASNNFYDQQSDNRTRFRQQLAGTEVVVDGVGTFFPSSRDSLCTNIANASRSEQPDHILTPERT